MTLSLRTGLTLCAGLLSLSLGAPALAQGHKDHGGGGHSHAQAEGHGGQVTMTKAHHFEVLFLRDSVRVYVYDMDQKAMDPRDLKGSVKLKFKSKKKKSQSTSFAYVAPKKAGHDKHAGHGKHAGAGVGYLEARVDLGKVSDGSAKATLAFEGLTNTQERSVTFRETVNLAKVVEFECPMKCVPATMAAGRCPKCGMNLARKAFVYACSMHPQVTAREAGANCWICGMKLSKPSPKKKGMGGHGKHGH